MEKCLIERIEALRIHLTTSTPVKLQEVVDTYNEFIEQTNRNEKKKEPTGCISCVRNMIKTMLDYIDKQLNQNITSNSLSTTANNEDVMAPEQNETKTMKTEDSTTKPHKKKGRGKYKIR